jgi:hypothetical protein
MKNKYKILVALLALVVGLGGWASYILLSSSSGQLPLRHRIFGKERSGKILLNFKGFIYDKDWAATFDIVNDTTEPITYIGQDYVGWSNYSFCTVAVRHGERVVDRTQSYCSNSGSLRTLKPGEIITFSVQKHEVKELLYAQEPDAKIKAQFGFEVFLGEEKRQKWLWSAEEVTFPEEVTYLDNKASE